MYNFFHVYKYHIGVLAALIVAVGVIRFPLNLFADTTSFFNTTSTTSASTSTTSTTTGVPVTFSVVPTTSVDCSEPTHPKTKTSFTANPLAGGSFRLSVGTDSGSISVMPGSHLLRNGVYNWSGVINPHYVGSGMLYGKFVVDVSCTLSGTGTVVSSASSTVTTESVVVTTGNVAVSYDDNHEEDNTTSSSGTSVAMLPQVSPSAPLPVTTTTSLPKISLPPPPPAIVPMPLPEAVNNSLPTTLPKTTITAPLPLYVGPPVHEEEHDDDEEKPVRVNVTFVEGMKSALPVIKHFERFDVKEQKEIANKVSKKEQKEITDRVNNPAGCTDVKECAVYCEQKEARETSACVAFAQTRIPTTSPVKPSLVGSVSYERIEHILKDAAVRPSALPFVVKSPQEFQQFCTDLAHADVCGQILIEHKLASNETVTERTQALIQNNKEEKKIFTERTGARVFVDSDNDELADYDEVNIYRTDPKSIDTDHDGVSDGDEIALRTNPRTKTVPPPFAGATMTETSASAVSLRALENNPLISGMTDKKLLKVNEVIVTGSATSTLSSEPHERARVPRLTFNGTALPNSFVTLYIFSEPIVVMVKTNPLGEWSYTLDKELPDGSHQVISAITDGDGRVLSKSEPLPFVKVAEAVTLGNVDLALPAVNKEPGFFSGISLYTFIALLIGVLGLGFLVIGVIVRRNEGEHDMMAR